MRNWAKMNIRRKNEQLFVIQREILEKRAIMSASEYIDLTNEAIFLVTCMHRCVLALLHTAFSAMLPQEEEIDAMVREIKGGQKAPLDVAFSQLLPSVLNAAMYAGIVSKGSGGLERGLLPIVTRAGSQAGTEELSGGK